MADATPARKRQVSSPSLPREYLRSQLEAHVTHLGYLSEREKQDGPLMPEIVRVSPVRGRTVYGETVLRSDLRRKTCHERLRFFSQRRTRRRSSILFFIGVAARDVEELEALLERLEIRTGLRGGHVHIVVIEAPMAPKRRKA